MGVIGVNPDGDAGLITKRLGHSRGKLFFGIGVEFFPIGILGRWKLGVVRECRVNEETSFVVLFEVSEDTLHGFDVALAGCHVVSAENGRGILDIESAKRNGPIGAAGHGSVPGGRFGIDEGGGIKFRMVSFSHRGLETAEFM